MKGPFEGRWATSSPHRLDAPRAGQIYCTASRESPRAVGLQSPWDSRGWPKSYEGVTMPTEFSIDALLPPAMASRAEDIGLVKARLGTRRMFALAVLAGAFISMGAIFATTVSAGGMAVRAADGALVYSTGLP